MKIVYVMDPYCGWCYAGSENVLSLYMRHRDLLPFEVIPAGMLTGELRCEHQPAMADAVLRSLRTIESETKACFGESYRQIVRTRSFMKDSEIPSRAITACRLLAPALLLPFTHLLLHAHFSKGMDLNDPTTFLECCEVLGIDKQNFFRTFHTEEIAAQTLQGFQIADRLAETYPALLYMDDESLIKLAEGNISAELVNLRLERILRGENTGLEED